LIGGVVKLWNVTLSVIRIRKDGCAVFLTYNFHIPLVIP
jgi:hypothetical protein